MQRKNVINFNIDDEVRALMLIAVDRAMSAIFFFKSHSMFYIQILNTKWKISKTKNLLSNSMGKKRIENFF